MDEHNFDQIVALSIYEIIRTLHPSGYDHDSFTRTRILEILDAYFIFSSNYTRLIEAVMRTTVREYCFQDFMCHTHLISASKAETHGILSLQPGMRETSRRNKKR